ncbi:MAG: hypothetical protein ACJ8AI_27285 [Rhodopila sp.]
MMDDRQLAAVLGALSHSKRLAIWRVLLPAGAAGLSKSAIAGRLPIMPSRLMLHLHEMAQAGVLTQQQGSQHIVYAANVELLVSTVQKIAQLLPADELASTIELASTMK